VRVCAQVASAVRDLVPVVAVDTFADIASDGASDWTTERDESSSSIVKVKGVVGR